AGGEEANTAAGPCFPVVALIHSFMDPGRRAVPRRDARPAAVPYLRTLRHRTAPADGARATIVRGLRAPRIEDSRLARPNPFFDDLRAPCRACTRSKHAALY